MAVAAAQAPRPRAGLVRNRRRRGEQVILLVLGAAAVLSILITVGIVFTLFEEGFGFFRDVSLVDFLTQTTWQPRAGKFGVLPLLGGSLLIALIAALIAVPLGLGAAIYLSEYADRRVRAVIKPVLELLAGVPTIVLGFFAIQTISPILGDLSNGFGRQSALAAGIVVGLLITPYISSLSEDSMRAVPRALRDGAYGLGATRREVATKIVFPAALSGIVASVVLGVSRAIGETMAVTLAAGSIPLLSANPQEPMQTITAYIVQTTKGEAQRGTIQYDTIFAVGILLFLVTLLVNLAAGYVVRRFRTEYR